MPELPEVEAIRRYLMAENIVGRRFARIEIGWPKSIVRPAADAEAFSELATGRRIGSLGRRGKYLIFPLIENDEDRFLVMHMGMTGSLHMRHESAPALPHVRTVLWMDDRRRIEFNDPRKWGRLWCIGNLDEAMSRLGPEPVDISDDGFAARAQRRRTRIKPALLDQSLIAGVGNIYADEALHRARISPLRRANRVSRERLSSLHRAIADILDHAVEFIASHPSEDGSPYVVNAHDGRMLISRRSGSECPRCRITISRRRINGRTAYYCHSCQH